MNTVKQIVSISILLGLLGGVGAEAGPYSDALRAYWTFDALTDVAPAGLTWDADYFADVSGNGRNAVIKREGVDANFSDLTPYTASGKFGNAFRSERGSTENLHYYMEVSTQAVDNLNFYGDEDFTFSFWTYVNYPLKDTWQRGYYFAKATGGGFDLAIPSRGYGFMREGGATAERLFWRVNSSNLLQSLTVPANGTDRWDAGMWAYWTIVRSHATGRVDVYVNGVSRVNGTQNTTLNDDWVTSAPFRIASRQGEHQHSFVWPCAANADGFIDDFAVFGKAMTAGEAKAAYSLGTHADLQYPMSNVVQLLDLHLAGSGTVTIGNLTWLHTSGLSGTEGEVQMTGDKYTVVIDGAAGTGVTGSPPPAGTVIIVR